MVILPQPGEVLPNNTQFLFYYSKLQPMQAYLPFNPFSGIIPAFNMPVKAPAAKPAARKSGKVVAIGTGTGIRIGTGEQLVPQAGRVKELEKLLAKEQLRHAKEIKKVTTAIRQKERKHIGHELHDNVNQLLAVAKLSLEAMELHTADNQFLRDRTVQALLTAIAEIRNLSKKEVVQAPAKGTLTGFINNLVNDINNTHVFKVMFSCDETDFELLAAGKKTALFRILQEQLTNTIKYSKATEVKVSLTHLDGVVCLHIQDNGIGFNIQKIKKGVGLPGIYKRARMYHGEAAVKSSKGCGCSLVVRIPFS